MDFVKMSYRTNKGNIEVYPKFIVKKSNDIMIRGGDFYAIWDEENQIWSTDWYRALEMIDSELAEYSKKYEGAHVLYLWDAESGMVDKFYKFCQKQMHDDYTQLDSHLIFANSPVSKEDYGSRRLPYSLEDIDIPAYEEIVSTLYSPDERMKIEWAIGSIVAGDSVDIQKFLVLYGDRGTGKSTVLNIIEMLFDGYIGRWDSKALSKGTSFALESLGDNPLVAIQHDGDLSKIEDNTLINSLVSHEVMSVNAKYKSIYNMRFNSFLFMGTNKPVRITDSKSGILRRLIDVTPTGKKIGFFKYKSLMKDIRFELGGIAHHCLQVYNANKNLYDNYVPLGMMGASNDFYNFVQEVYDIFISKETITLGEAWDAYKRYIDDARVAYPMSKRVFKEELKNYFKEFEERKRVDGVRLRNCYSGFKYDIFEQQTEQVLEPENKFIFKEQPSLLDDFCAECPAQLATKNGTPSKAWDDVETTLKDIDTHELHYVRVPENHIVIDFDIPDELGNKSFKKNLEAANAFPLTYAELSKSGAGIHLHYLYSGDVSQLSAVYGDHIEVKVFTGKSSLRRMLTRCNDIPIATITSGLPFKIKKKGDPMIDESIIKDQRHLENKILYHLEKKACGNTTQSVNFIKEVLDQAYNSGMTYDIRPMKDQIIRFAMNSTHNSNGCLKTLSDVHWCSDDILAEPNEVQEDSEDKPIAFYDVEVFPNLFVLCYKMPGLKTQKLINPNPDEVKDIINRYRLIGFNNRRYDNHILYARTLGYMNAQLYDISQRIIKGDKNAFFREAYNISYTDIYDFMAQKRSLKKLEIEMHINHLELGLPWDKPCPEELWDKVAEYCCNDVEATEAAFEYLKDDWEGRKILAKLAGGTVNMSTNALSTMFIFGKNKTPQDKFHYRNLADPVTTLTEDELKFLSEIKPEMINGKDAREPESFMPFFPGYVYDHGKSTYKGEEVGEGGLVRAEHGIWFNVALLDIASMHPNSIVDELLFGLEYTKKFYDILNGRLKVKHGEYEDLKTYADGAFVDAVNDILEGKINPKSLAYALKIVINSIYGLTKAHFPNAFKDDRNIDNIVAKRGALFMVDMKQAVEERGFKVVHVKTDSIKIPDATPEIIEFVKEFGKLYGYTFEHEATYKRMCLVNDAVYVAKYATEEECIQMYGYSPEDNSKHGGEWTATGKQFKVPYVFKTLFDTSSPIDIYDMGEVKSSQTALYLDNNEDLSLDEHNYCFVGKVGQFTPVKEGKGGGDLVVIAKDKEGNDKYDFAQEAKGYKWKQTLEIHDLDDIDRNFYIEKVDAAKDVINEFCIASNYDLEEFLKGA